jgi:hypothetical protein
VKQFMENYASWVLALSGTAAIYFVGRKQIWGWLWLTFNECLWVFYALITKQYGFIFAAVAYSIVYIRSYRHWKDLDNDKQSWRTFLKILSDK